MALADDHAPPSGIVIVDVVEAREATDIATWMRLENQRPVIASWKDAVIDLIVVPVIGVFTEHPNELEAIKERFPLALRIALLDSDWSVEGADFVVVRPFRLDLYRERRSLMIEGPASKDST